MPRQVIVSDDEMLLLLGRIGEAGAAERAAARLDYEGSRENSEAADRWEELARLFISIFERAGVIPKRKRCSSCRLFLYAGEIQLEGDELCMECVDEGIQAAKERGDDVL
jgi:recombinational DNA repair protein (RecF pathway)